MATQADFSVEEWEQVSRLPMNVSIAAAIAEADSTHESNQEILAGFRELALAEKSYANNELIQALLEDLKHQEAAGAIDHEIEMTAEERDAFVAETLAAAASAVQTIGRVASAQEVADYAQWLCDIASATVQATESGGFLGIGGTEVSEAEQTFIAKLDRALGAI